MANNVLVRCRKCKNADFYVDLYAGGRGFDCLKQRELEKIFGEELVEDFFDGKVDIECPFFEVKEG